MAEDLFGIVGTVIASAYHVEHVVAEGGFGVVYRARHGGFRAPVALKCLKVPQHLAPEQQRRFVEQFRAEGELMFRLSASIANVVRPLHVDVMNTRTGAFVPFMVLEWLEGDTLDALLRARVAAGKRPLPSTEALELLEPVARALARAHDFRGPSGKESIAHCDLKPENVFVARAGGERIVKILDFGIANVRSAATHAARGVGAQPALFTPAYGAPEQWNPQSFGETGPWTDVWGLGLTLSETLVGRPVIAGDHVSMMRQALDPTRRPTPAAHGVVIGDELEAVLTRALACEPRERYPDAGALWRALQQAAARPVEVAQSPAPEIPDLVPVPRRPSGAQKLDVGPRRTPSGARELDIGPARNPSAAQRLDLDAARGAAIELGVTGATIRSKAEPAVGRSASGTHKLGLPDLGLANFDDDSGGEGSGLALDISPDELVHRGSLAPIAPPPGAPELPSEPPISLRSGAIPGGPISSSLPPTVAVSPLPSPPSGAPAAPSLPPEFSQPSAPPSVPTPPARASPPAASPAKPAPARSEVKRSPAPSEPEAPLARRIVPGLVIAGSSIAVTLLDRAYASVHGEVFTLGPLRSSWIAAALLLAGLVLVVRQVLARN